MLSWLIIVSTRFQCSIVFYITAFDFHRSNTSLWRPDTGMPGLWSHCALLGCKCKRNSTWKSFFPPAGSSQLGSEFLEGMYRHTAWVNWLSHCPVAGTRNKESCPGTRTSVNMLILSIHSVFLPAGCAGMVIGHLAQQLRHPLGHLHPILKCLCSSPCPTLDSNFLEIHSPGRSCLSLSHPHGRPRRSSWLQALGWLSLNYYGHLGSELVDGRSESLAVFKINFYNVQVYQSS